MEGRLFFMGVKEYRRLIESLPHDFVYYCFPVVIPSSTLPYMELLNKFLSLVLVHAIQQIHTGSFKYNLSFRMQNLVDVCLRNLDLVLSIPSRACKCCRTKMTSSYHGDDRKYSPIGWDDSL